MNLKNIEKFSGFFLRVWIFWKSRLVGFLGGNYLGCKPKIIENPWKCSKIHQKSTFRYPFDRLKLSVWRSLCTSAGARSVLNRKYSEIPDRQNFLDEKYFFIMEKNYFENFDLKIFQKIFFRKSKILKIRSRKKLKIRSRENFENSKSKFFETFPTSNFFSSFEKNIFEKFPNSNFQNIFSPW